MSLEQFQKLFQMLGINFKCYFIAFILCSCKSGVSSEDKGLVIPECWIKEKGESGGIQGYYLLNNCVEDKRVRVICSVVQINNKTLNEKLVDNYIEGQEVCFDFKRKKLVGRLGKAWLLQGVNSRCDLDKYNTYIFVENNNELYLALFSYNNISYNEEYFSQLCDLWVNGGSVVK